MSVSIRLKRITYVALPVVAAMVSQNLFNLVDTAMVSSLGRESLAAVGLAGIINFVLAWFFLGMPDGVQVNASKRFGEGKPESASAILQGGLLICVVASVPFIVCGYLFATYLFHYLQGDPQVVAYGSSYLQWRVVGMLAFGINQSFRGYWNAKQTTTIYLRTLIGMHILNVLLNWVLIYGRLGFPSLGVNGAAIASTISAYAGSAYYLLYERVSVDRKKILVAISQAREIVSTVWYSALRELFFVGGLAAFLWISGRQSTDSLAITHVLITLMLMGFLPSIGIGAATGSFVGRCIGRSEDSEMQRWVNYGLSMAFVMAMVLNMAAFLNRESILGWFLSDPNLREQAMPAFFFMLGALLIDSFGNVFAQASIARGQARKIAIVSTGIQWAFFVPLSAVLGQFGLMFLWLAYLLYRALYAGAMAVVWFKGRDLALEALSPRRAD